MECAKFDAGEFDGDAFGGDAFGGDAYGGDAFGGDAFGGDAIGGDVFGGDAFRKFGVTVPGVLPYVVWRRRPRAPIGTSATITNAVGAVSIGAERRAVTFRV